MITNFLKAAAAIMLLLVSIVSCRSNAAGSSVEKANTDSSAAFDPSSLRSVIEQKNAAYGHAVETGDSTGAMAHFTEDAHILGPGMQQLIGKPAFAPILGGLLKAGIKKFTDETTALYGSEACLVEEGNYFLGGANNTTLDKGKYIAIWKKENGDWRVYSDMWNTSLPPADSKK